MNKETRKIAQACFIGGVLFTVAAFFLTPMFWWLGTLAGIAGGYLGYEFRAVLRAVSKAWQAAKAEMGDIFPKVIQAIVRFLRRPHPFGYLSFFITIGMSYLLVVSGFIIAPLEKQSLGFMSGYIFGCIIFFILIWLLFLQLLWLIVLLSIQGEFYLEAPDKIIGADGQLEDKAIPLTYGNGAYYLVKGLELIVLFSVWKAWKYLFIGIKWAGTFAGRFLKHLFIFIHSNERVLCAIDGTLGGIAAFLWLAPSAETLTAKAAVAIFGGLLGAGFGVINYELVSKRWLKLVPQN